MSSIRSWLWRHRRAIVGTSLAAAGTYALYVAYRKKRELDALCAELLSPSASAAPDREKRVREHFDATQRESDNVLSRELGKTQARLQQLLDTDAYRAAMKRDGAGTDMARWAELRVLVTARLVASLYALALETLRHRVHLNIVARHYLIETQEADAAAAEPGNDTGAVRRPQPRRPPHRRRHCRRIAAALPWPRRGRAALIVVTPPPRPLRPQLTQLTKRRFLFDASFTEEVRPLHTVTYRYLPLPTVTYRYLPSLSVRRFVHGRGAAVRKPPRDRRVTAA